MGKYYNPILNKEELKERGVVIEPLPQDISDKVKEVRKLDLFKEEKTMEINDQALRTEQLLTEFDAVVERIAAWKSRIEYLTKNLDRDSIVFDVLDEIDAEMWLVLESTR